MIRCPLCRTKTRVLETRGTATSVRRRRACSSARCDGKVTTVEVVTRDCRPSSLAGGAVLVPARQLAKLRQAAASIVEPDRRVAKLVALVAAIEESPL